MTVTTPYEAGKTSASFALATNRLVPNPFNTGCGLEHHNEWQRGYDEAVQVAGIQGGKAIIDDPLANATAAEEP